MYNVILTSEFFSLNGQSIKKINIFLNNRSFVDLGKKKFAWFTQGVFP